MSQLDLWTVVGRAKAEEAFAERLFRNFQQALSEEGYQLTSAETTAAEQALSQQNGSIAQPVMDQITAQSQVMVDRIKFESDLTKERMTQQVARMNDLGKYTVQILKDTLGNAARTYKMINFMNVVMFTVGIGLFLFAAGFAVYSTAKAYSLVFAGLGTVSFIAMFMIGPIERSQDALSNLVQVEISFMNYFEQITFWETFALTPRGNPPAPDLANIEKASEMLQARANETVKMLQQYVETHPREARRATLGSQ